MQRPNLLGGDYPSFSEFIKQEEIKPEALDRLLSSPLIKAFQDQLSTNPTAAIELGEFYLSAWRFAVQRNADPNTIANYLRLAIHHLNLALVIDDRQFPSRALDLLTEIRSELSAAQRQIEQHAATMHAAAPTNVTETKKTTTTVEPKKPKTAEELTPLDEDDFLEEVVVVPATTEQKVTAVVPTQVTAKALGAAEWLLYLRLLEPVFQAERIARQPISTDDKDVVTEVERRKRVAEETRAEMKVSVDTQRRQIDLELEQFIIDENDARVRIIALEASPEAKAAATEIKISLEEQQEIAHEMQWNRIWPVLLKALTPEKEFKGIPLESLRVAHAQAAPMMFELLEHLAISDSPLNKSALVEIARLLRQKFGERQGSGRGHLYRPIQRVNCRN